MLQKLPKFLEVAQKTGSCPKVAEQLVDRAITDQVISSMEHNLGIWKNFNDILFILCNRNDD